VFKHEYRQSGNQKRKNIVPFHLTKINGRVKKTPEKPT